MDENHKERVMMAALAGLLHDVGKFSQRAGEQVSTEWSEGKTRQDFGYQHALLTWHFVNKYLPADFKQAGTMAAFHHRPHGEGLVIQVADRLSAGERREDEHDDSDRKSHPRQLQSIFCSVTANDRRATAVKYLPLENLRLDENAIFPKDALPDGEVWSKYEKLWNGFCHEAETLKKVHEQQPDLEAYLEAMLSLMQRYTWCIPSAYFNAVPDVSLYDHSRMTAALAACLAEGSFSDGELQTLAKDPPGFEKPVVLLVRGDLSGIQKFIYRLAQPDASTEHVAKRLRGRSFYLQLLMEVVIYWLLQELKLPPVCTVMVSGGRFDLLLPLSAEGGLHTFRKQIQAWLLDEFQCEVGLNFAIEPLKAADLADSRRAFRALDETLEREKLRKWHGFIHDAAFFMPQGKQWHICNVCHLTPLDDPGTCPLCNQHAHIGTHLPFITHLAFCNSIPVGFPANQIVRFSQKSPLAGLSVLLIKSDSDSKQVLATSGWKTVYAINQPEHAVQFGETLPLRFLANTAPRARGKFFTQGADAVDDGNVLHFEAIASLSRGADRVGIIKADVDRLGFLMSEGLTNPTLSRVAAFSRNLDLFFAGYLNCICEQAAAEWLEKYRDKIQNASKTNGLFYVLYSGGDDSFIVGPWDATLFLAQKIQADFRRFAAENPALTLSAGYVQVKPRYPTQKFSELVDEAEKDAKNGGRNRLAAFGETMLWTDDDLDDRQQDASFEWLQKEAKRWVDAIDAKPQELPSGLIYDLGGLFRQHRDKNGDLRPMWSPRLYYTLARRLKPETRKKFSEGIFKAITSRKVLVPVSITSLSIRERSE